MHRTLLAALVIVACSSESSSSPEPEECFAATTCRRGDCNGPITKSGCSAQCGPGEVNEDTCFNDAAVDADVGDAPAAGCGAIATFADTAKFARELHVQTGGMYTTIDAALKAAKPGDKVIVHAGNYAGGTFAENLQGTAAQPIMITGAAGEAKPHIQGGAEGLHLTKPSYVIVQDLEISGQTGNALNIDDGGVAASPAHHLVLRGLAVHDVASGNHDGIKLSGVDDTFVLDSAFAKIGGQMVDMVGCHHVTVARSKFKDGESVGVQMKGGSSDNVVTRNWFENAGERGVNMGGSTGLEFFRPADAKFEAARIVVSANVFIGGDTPFAYVGCDECTAENNTILQPTRWAARILQETVDPARFVPSRKGRFLNNVVVVGAAISAETVNVGSNTEPASFTFANNLWFQAGSPSFRPTLPVMETAAVYADPLVSAMDAHPRAGSPAIAKGANATGADYDGKCWKTPPSIGAFEAP
jgi:hypothetical protein